MAEGSNNMHSINRNKKEKFIKYMTLNPFYFKWTFPGFTILEAWDYVNNLKFNHNSFESFKGGETWPE